MKVCVRNATVGYHDGELGIHILGIPIPDGQQEIKNFDHLVDILKDKKNNNSKPIDLYVPAEHWGRIPPEKNPSKELQVIADLFNGYKEVNGKKEHIKNWVPKIINLEKE